MRSRYARDAVEVRSWYARGAIEVRSWCGRGTLARGALPVWCVSLTFQQAILYVLFQGGRKASLKMTQTCENMNCGTPFRHESEKIVSNFCGVNFRLSQEVNHMQILSPTLHTLIKSHYLSSIVPGTQVHEALMVTI